MIEVFQQVAAALKMDPTKVAEVNDGYMGHDMAYVKEHYGVEGGFDVSRDSLKEILAKGKQAIGWDEKWHLPGTKILPNGNYHGLGVLWMNSWTHTPGQTVMGVRMHQDGTVAVLGQSCDIGVNRDTTYSQVAASEIGVKYEDVFLAGADYSSFETKEPGGSAGMSATLPPLIRACQKLKQTILEYALAPRPGGFGSPARPPLFPDKKVEELNLKDGFVFEIAKPDNRFPVADVASANTQYLFAWDRNPSISSTGIPTAVMGRQCYLMEVEVNPDTGGVDVKDIVVVNDAGKIINFEAFEGQQYGGTYMGLGRCKQEQMIWDPQTGVRLTDNLINYPIAVMNDTAAIECYQVETGLGYGSYGSFGIGESGGACGCVLTRYAVHNAIGKWVDLKTTPEKILKALGKA